MQMVMQQRRRIIAISGPSGGGKTFLVKKFVKYQDISTDDFYIGKSCMKPDANGLYNFDSPDAVDLVACAKALELLATQPQGTVVPIPKYDMKISERVGYNNILAPSEDAIIIVEGLFSFYPPLLNMSDFKIFVEAAEEVILARRYRRDHCDRGRSYKSILEQYPTVMEGYEKYVKPMRKYADLIIDFGTVI